MIYTTQKVRILEIEMVGGGIKRMSTSINIDPNLWDEVKISAIRKKVTVSEYFEEALKEKLERENEREKGAELK